ncbi:uncharacterized protein YALI1_B06628g [Yarrowia lipolytica]|uniref:Uncharacterized protein n=1 Tax=Yarrowia lipolytica TaxID=4952 RepID=A0A1D8N6H9_YARLL|nr:hypothetical protein YALI1_B06628g [Yarrowia lipolytica]
MTVSAGKISAYEEKCCERDIVVRDIDRRWTIVFDTRYQRQNVSVLYCVCAHNFTDPSVSIQLQQFSPPYQHNCSRSPRLFPQRCVAERHSKPELLLL